MNGETLMWGLFIVLYLCILLQRFHIVRLKRTLRNVLESLQRANGLHANDRLRGEEKK
jgi:hypothetical protein